MFEFLLIQWQFKKIDEIYLKGRVDKKQITEEEYKKIISTPQID